ncbi:RNA polymerase sigma factor [Neolewinella persica]|uniref:RNA polymerase sigma factor n=1 Tax=Neolewinella persica TaxID=70998 RepID=UPI00036DC586|nr:RNA polymerase sigma factor [Neolewinella persica]
MRTPEKDTLIDRCLRGNRDAQNELYRREVHGVFHLVIRLVANRMDAEDLTQECFIKVFQRLPQFRGEASVRTWIKRIAINLSLEHLRRQQLLLVPVDDEVLIEEPPLPQVDMTQVHHAIKDLPKGCRVVLTLYLLEGYRHAEIADILAVSVSTVKSQYWRAKHLLRLALTQKITQHE